MFQDDGLPDIRRKWEGSPRVRRVYKVVIRRLADPSISFRGESSQSFRLTASQHKFQQHNLASYLVEPIFVVVPAGVESLEDAANYRLAPASTN